jgi:nuclease-like protein
MKVTLFSCGPAANESELTAFKHLESRLCSTVGDEEWVLLANLAFSFTHRLQSDEIDIVVIGPPGIRVIEVKHWTAQWADEHMDDLVAQEAERVTEKARKIGTTLRRIVTSLPRVAGAILLTQEPAKVKRLTGKEVRGVPFYTLTDWNVAVGLDSPAKLTPQQVKLLGRALDPKVAVAIDGSLRRFAGYVNLELQTPKEQRFHRIYKGIHSARQDRVVLHLYDLSVRDESNAEAKARREYEALHRLQLHTWAPRILESFQDAPGYAGEMFFFTLVDPAAPSIEDRMHDGSWDTTARLAFARSTVGAVKELHNEGAGHEPMVHRNLTSKNVLVKHDNSPILTGFDRTKIPSDISVASPGSPIADEITAAPEVRALGIGAADYRSDIYSLCACLTMIFENRNDDLSQRALPVLRTGIVDDPEARVTLQDLEARLSELLGDSVPSPPPPPARFWTEDQLIRFRDRDYRLVTRLGSGGVGTTFKVVEVDRATKEDLGTFVASSTSSRRVQERRSDSRGRENSNRESIRSVICATAARNSS